MKHAIKPIVLCALAIAAMASSPAFASAGCSEFRGVFDDETKGPGGSRTGAGFNAGDTLTVTIHQAQGQMKSTVSLLQYASPDGPYKVVVEETSDSFTYTVPKPTSDFIYLNYGGARRGVVVTWACTPVTNGKANGSGSQ
jgi:hypothetical protein